MFTDTEFGISEAVKIRRANEEGDIYSREFNSQLKNEQDIFKIKVPQATIDYKSTGDMYTSMSGLFDGILDIGKKGVPGFIFAPWDELIRWYGIQEALEDLLVKPEYVHKVMNRLINAYISKLNQYEKLNLLALNNCNYRIGSGG